MEDNNNIKPKKEKRTILHIDLGFWEIALLCATVLLMTAMFTGHIDKIINLFK